jgi:threonine dehydratase
MTPFSADLTIRRATAEDAASIASVLRRAFAVYAPLYTQKAYAATTPGTNDVATRMSEGPIWVALQGSQLAGTVSIVVKPEGVYVRSMAVLPSVRGLGIGYRLLNEIESFARANGYGRLFLSTTPFLLPAIHLYERFGFQRTTDGPHDLFGTTLFTMEKTVSALVGGQSPQRRSVTHFGDSGMGRRARPNWSEIESAREFLKRYFGPTRLIPAPSLTRRAEAELYVKLESEMPIGSFKVRGALYALHRAMSKTNLTEVVAASTGNHGAAVAYAAKALGIKAKIFLPHDANPVKQSLIRDLGAEIIAFGKDISEAFADAERCVSQSGTFMLNDATNPDVPAGAATIAIEIFEKLPNVSSIWVPMGDTALIRGIASAVKHLRAEVRVIGVQAKRAPAYYLSWKRGTSVATETCDTIADGLATRIPVEENVTAIRELVDEVRLVTEDEMLDAIANLQLNEGIRAEPAGAAAASAWLANGGTESYGNTVLLVTGSNLSEPVLKEALKRANSNVQKKAVSQN